MSTGDYITYADDQNGSVQSNFFDMNTLMTVLVMYCLICGVVTALVAKHNDRSIPLAFMSGFFLGQLGIVAHMIMGKKKE